MPHRHRRRRRRRSGGVEPGDKVLYPRDAGYEVRLAGTAVRVMRRGELIARVHD